MYSNKSFALRVGVVVAALASPVVAQTTHTVELSGFVFTPADITIALGDTVHWDWVSGNHNVESGVIVAGSGVHDGNFRSGDPTADTSTVFDLVFDQAFLDAHPMPNDTYPYYCIVHDILNMAGTITVQSPQAVPAVSVVGLLILVFAISVIAGFVIFNRHRKLVVPVGANRSNREG